MGEENSKKTKDKSLDERFQKEVVKLIRDIEEIETGVLELSSHFEEYYLDDMGDLAVGEREEKALEKLLDDIQYMYLTLRELGDNNIGFQTNYSDRVEALKLRVLELQAISLRLLEGIKELEVMTSKHSRVRKRRLMDMIAATGVVATKKEAEKIVQEGGEPNFPQEIQVIQGQKAAKRIRLRIEDQERLDEKIEFLKTMMTDTEMIIEVQNGLMQKQVANIENKGEKSKKSEAKSRKCLSYFKIFLLFFFLTIAVSCIAVGVTARVRPELFGLPKRSWNKDI